MIASFRCRKWVHNTNADDCHSTAIRYHTKTCSHIPKANTALQGGVCEWFICLVL